MRISYQSKLAILGVWLCLFAFIISFSYASSESVKEEDTFKKVPSNFKKNDHDLFNHPIPGLKNFFYRRKKFFHKSPEKPKPQPTPVEKPKTHPTPSQKPPCPPPDHKTKHESLPVAKPQPHHVRFFKKPFFPHPNKPISP